MAKDGGQRQSVGQPAMADITAVRRASLRAARCDKKIKADWRLAVHAARLGRAAADAISVKNMSSKAMRQAGAALLSSMGTRAQIHGLQRHSDVRAQ